MSHLVQVRPIRSEKDFATALLRIEELRNAPRGSAAHDEWDVLVTLAVQWEREHEALAEETAREAILGAMDRLGIDESALAPLIGSGEEIADFLSGQRGLDADQMKLVHERFKIPYDVLIR